MGEGWGQRFFNRARGQGPAPQERPGRNSDVNDAMWPICSPIKARRGTKEAILAVAASMLTAIDFMRRNRVPYRDLGSPHFDERQHHLPPPQVA
jgi:hypothetical protein